MELQQIEATRRAEAEFTLMPTSPKLSDILLRADLTDDLLVVEQRLFERANSRSPLLAAAGRHTVGAGGKRLRAALVLLSARLGMYDRDRAVRPATAVELLHAASLVHDDLVDHALQRRGQSTVHARWDNDVALMLGDYMFAASANELAAEPDPRIIRFYAAAARTVVEGELHPVTQLAPRETAVAQYWRKIGAKTASLFEVACQAGIAVAGGSDADIAALGRFGHGLGVAFQIVDDVLDFTGDEQQLGKPAGNDLREGTFTLPLIYAVEQTNHPLLRQVAQTLTIPQADVPALVEAVIGAGGTARAMDDAHAMVLRATRELERFPHSPAHDACLDILQFVIARHV